MSELKKAIQEELQCNSMIAEAVTKEVIKESRECNCSQAAAKVLVFARMFRRGELK